MDLAGLLNLGLSNPVPGGDGLSTAQFIISIVRNGLIILFAIVVIFAIIYSATAGLKFVTSEGASDKVEEAREAIKNVLIGVAASFMGVIGVFIISNIFSPNTSAELSLRCFFGDFYTCGMREVGDIAECTRQGEIAIATTNALPPLNAPVAAETNNNTVKTSCPGGRAYCVAREFDPDLSPKPAVPDFPAAACIVSGTSKAVIDNIRTN